MKHYKTKHLLFLLLIALPMATFAQTLTGKVVKIADGDTFTLLVDGHDQYKIRLDGIDCPEKRQNFSKKATQYLSSMIWEQTVTVKVSTKDRYGRYIGKVSTPAIADVNLEMIKAGYAWHYKEYNDDPVYADAEAKAREQKKGLWLEDNPIYPQDFRKAQREKNKQKKQNRQSNNH